MSPAAQSALPDDLAALNRQLDAIDGQARKLVADLCETRFNWQPDEGRSWSVGQCIQHLAQTNHVYVDAIRMAVGKARASGKPNRPIVPGFLARRFIGVLEPPVRVRVKTNAKATPPSAVRKDEGLEAFLRSEDEVRRLIAECAAFDPNAARFPNPFLRGLNWTIGSGLYIIAAHDRRHLWQAEQVRQRPGFPHA
jgi:hypothetical protein